MSSMLMPYNLITRSASEFSGIIFIRCFCCINIYKINGSTNNENKSRIPYWIR